MLADSRFVSKMKIGRLRYAGGEGGGSLSAKIYSLCPLIGLKVHAHVSTFYPLKSIKPIADIEEVLSCGMRTERICG